MSAIRWIMLIEKNNLFDIVPGSLEQPDEVDDAWMDGLIQGKELEQAATSALETASGVKWWIAVKLVKTSLALPELYGKLVLRGVDPSAVSLGAYVAAVYSAVVANADQKQKRKVDQELEATPAGMSALDRYDEDEAVSGLEAMLMQRGQGSTLRNGSTDTAQIEA